MAKIYYMGKRVDTPKYKFKRFIKRLFNMFLITLIGLVLVLGLIFIGRSTSKIEVKEVEKEVVVEVDKTAPVLERIAFCESGGKHFDKNGQILVAGNRDGSVDIGKYQINNRIWGAKATEMGLNLFVEKDNEEFAKYLFSTRGSEPWVWSKGCWNK